MSASEKLKELVVRGYRAWTAPDSFRNPKQVIGDPESPALALMIAARKICGPGWLAWEPETLWLELSNPPERNRDKLMAGITLTQHPSFWWDWRVFGQTCMAFNDLAVFPEQLPEPTVEQMNWAAFEAELILALSEETTITPKFDANVKSFIAVCAHNQGVVRLPEDLRGAQPHLNKLLTPEGRTLSAQVKQQWQQRADRDDLASLDVEDNAAGVQLAHLVRTQLYAVKRANTLLTYF